MRKSVVLIGLLLLASPLFLKSQSVQPPNGLSQIQAYSIFLENYKNDEFRSAIEYGAWIHKNMPRKIKGYSKFDLERNLDRLITAYGGYAKALQDPSEREAYLDTALIIFDKVFEEFSEDEIDFFDWHLKKGRFYQEHSDFIDNAQGKAAEEYLKLYDLDPQKLTEAADGYYVQALIQNLVAEGQKDKALSIIETTTPHANEKTIGYFDQVQDRLFDSPTERIAFLEEKLKENPEDPELLGELADLYEQQEMVDKASQMNKRLYELDPNYENTKNLADIAIENANYDQALRYLKEAMGKTDNSQQLAEINFEISEAYLNKDNLQQARRYARQAANQDPNWGQPYMQIATIYARAVNNCTSGRKMEREDKVVYWLVLDYLDKAKRVDSSVSSAVSRQYQSYKPVTPTTEEKFFKGWETGDKMKVDESLNPCYGWINETTTVR